MDIAVVGNEEFVLGFRLAGVRKVISCADGELDQRISGVLADKDVGILVLHDDSMKKIPPNMRTRLRNSSKPVLITIGEEEEDLRAKVRRAIGIDLYKSK